MNLPSIRCLPGWRLFLVSLPLTRSLLLRLGRLGNIGITLFVFSTKPDGYTQSFTFDSFNLAVFATLPFSRRLQSPPRDFPPSGSFSPSLPYPWFRRDLTNSNDEKTLLIRKFLKRWRQGRSESNQLVKYICTNTTIILACKCEHMLFS